MIYKNESLTTLENIPFIPIVNKLIQAITLKIKYFVFTLRYPQIFFFHICQFGFKASDWKVKHLKNEEKRN